MGRKSGTQRGVPQGFAFQGKVRLDVVILVLSGPAPHLEFRESAEADLAGGLLLVGPTVPLRLPVALKASPSDVAGNNAQVVNRPARSTKSEGLDVPWDRLAQGGDLWPFPNPRRVLFSGVFGTRCA